MTPVSVLVLPYYVAGKISLEEADEVEKLVDRELSGMTSDQTPVSYLVQAVEYHIDKVKEK